MNKNIKNNLTKAKQVMLGTKKAKLITFGAASLTALATIAIPVAVVSTSGKVGAKPHQDIDEPTFLIKYPGSIVNHGIVAYAFKDATLPSGFALPSTITDIGENAFSGASLPVNFMVPATITSMDASAFAGATIPFGYHWEQDGKIVSTVTDGGHEYKVVVTSFKDITEDYFLAIYPGSIVNHQIVANAFKDATLPTDFALPSTITDIGENAFSGATLPVNFMVPSTVASIHTTAFDGANLPIGYHWEQDGQIISKVTDGGHEYKIVVSSFEDINEDYFLAIYPGSIVNHGIVDHAFENIALPADFALPNTIQVIGVLAFSSTTLPIGFTLHASLSKVVGGAFHDATLPVGFIIPASISYGHGVFAGSHFLGHLTIDNPTLSDYMFANADLKQGITLSDSVKNLGNAVFAGAKLPEDFTLPDSITAISGWTFLGTTLPSQFVISPSVTTIANNAFQNAALPAGFAIPASVTSIDATAFDGATIPAGYHWEQDGKRVPVSEVNEGSHDYKVVAN